jgi:hypothetical protein
MQKLKEVDERIKELTILMNTKFDGEATELQISTAFSAQQKFLPEFMKLISERSILAAQVKILEEENVKKLNALADQKLIYEEQLKMQKEDVISVTHREYYMTRNFEKILKDLNKDELTHFFEKYDEPLQPLGAEVIKRLILKDKKIQQRAGTVEKLIKKRIETDKKYKEKGNEALDIEKQLLALGDSYTKEKMTKVLEKIEYSDSDSDVDPYDLDSDDDETVPKQNASGEVNETFSEYVLRMRKAVGRGNEDVYWGYNVLKNEIARYAKLFADLDNRYKAEVLMLKNSRDDLRKFLTKPYYEYIQHLNKMKDYNKMTSQVKQIAMSQDQDLKKINELDRTIKEMQDEIELHKQDKEKLLKELRTTKRQADMAKIEKQDIESKLASNETLKKHYEDQIRELDESLEDSKENLKAAAYNLQNKLHAQAALHDEELNRLRISVVEVLARDCESFKEQLVEERYKANMLEKTIEIIRMSIDSEKTLSYNEGKQDAQKKYIVQVQDTGCQTDISQTEINRTKKEIGNREVYQYNSNLGGHCKSMSNDEKKRTPEWFEKFEGDQEQIKWHWDQDFQSGEDLMKIPRSCITVSTGFNVWYDKLNIKVSDVEYYLGGIKQFREDNEALKDVKSDLHRRESEILAEQAKNKQILKEIKDFTLTKDFLNSLTEAEEKLLNQVNTFRDICYNPKQRKFFSYIILDWEDILIEKFKNTRFLKIDINKTTKEENCVLFQFLTNLNSLTGSKSHLWFGNELNRKYNHKDYLERPRSEFGLIERAQDTFTAWFNSNAQNGLNSLKKNLINRDSIVYSELLSTIGNTTIPHLRVSTRSII